MMNYFQPYMPQQQSDERIWVQGEDAARAYLVAPNSFVRLWDNNANVFYEKRADQTGRLYMETYKYERVDAPKQINLDDTIKSLDERLKRLERGLDDATDEHGTDDD